MAAAEVGVISSILTNPLNVVLLLICAILLYKILNPRSDEVFNDLDFCSCS